MITAIFNTTAKTWSIQNTGSDSHSLEIEVCVALPANIKGLSIKVTGCPEFKGGISTTQSTLFKQKIDVVPNVAMSIVFDANGTQVTESILPPKPTKPVGDFVWDDVSHTWQPTEAQRAKDMAIVNLGLTDAKMARIAEDLIALLGNEDSLPAAAKAIIDHRKALRTVISGG